ERTFELFEALIAARQIGELSTQSIAPRDHLRQRWPIFALQPLEQRQPLLHLLQALRRRIDSVGVLAEKASQIFELRFDAVARLEIGPELRIEGRQFRDSTPDVSQCRENRIVTLVQRGVALRTETLDAFGARQNLAHRGEIGVFGRIPERGAIELAELKRDQVL